MHCKEESERLAKRFSRIGIPVEEIAKDIYMHHFDDDVKYPDVLNAIEAGTQKGAELGFQKGIKAKINTTTISDCPIKDAGRITYNEIEELLDKQIEATYKVVEELNKAKELIKTV